jgi:hypothetical protein
MDVEYSVSAVDNVIRLLPDLASGDVRNLEGHLQLSRVKVSHVSLQSQTMPVSLNGHPAYDPGNSK